MTRQIVIIAGPNGAGKTTFAREFLPFEADCPLFINADLIAAGLSPFQPEVAAIHAGRLMLEEIDRNAAAGQSFAFETTLAGHTYVKRIPRWREAGYPVKLMFLSLGTAEEAIERVATRVQQGGHDVAADVIRRRFVSGMRNFLEVYRGLVDSWQWFDNRGPVAESLEGERSMSDPVMQGAPRALLRAAKRAREIARQTNTPLIIVRDGVLVREYVTDDDEDPRS